MNSPWAAMWRALTRFDAGKLTPWLALRNTAGVLLPLVAGALSGNLLSGVVMATGALNVAFADGHGPYSERARRMLTASGLVGLAVFLGPTIGHSGFAAVQVSALWAFAAGMLVAVSTAAADVGTISTVTLVVYASRSTTLERAVLAGLLALAGGLLQTGLSLAMWRLRRYQPERRVLGALFDEIAQTAASSTLATTAPPASTEIVQAHEALAGLSSDYSVEAERHRGVLNQAERLRLSVLAVDRLRQRMQKYQAAEPDAALLTDYLRATATVLHNISATLLSGKQPYGTTAALEGVRLMAEPLRNLASQDPRRSAMQTDALVQMDALAGQLRAAADLAAHATPEGSDAFAQRESQQPWRLRLSGRLATLRANLTLNSTAFRHALRLAVCLALGDTIGRGLRLERSYWIPMTIMIVLKPDFAATFSRGVLRLAGTAVGLVLATALFHVLPDTTVVQIALLGVFLFLLRWVGPANYGIFVTNVSALVVMLVALTGTAPKDVIAARGLNTLIGGMLALVAYAVWPTWERTKISESLAQMLDAYRAYFGEVAAGYTQAAPEGSPALDAARVAGRVARTNLEASTERFSVEPLTTASEMASIAGMLASSHRFIHAAMSLEAGTASGAQSFSPDAFQRLADDVSKTLLYCARLLRNGKPGAALPDLRRDHQLLLEADAAVAGKHALLHSETDRITNSLNTLREQVELWTLLEPSPR